MSAGEFKFKIPTEAKQFAAVVSALLAEGVSYRAVYEDSVITITLTGGY